MLNVQCFIVWKLSSFLQPYMVYFKQGSTNHYNNISWAKIELTWKWKKNGGKTGYIAFKLEKTKIKQTKKEKRWKKKQKPNWGNLFWIIFRDFHYTKSIYNLDQRVMRAVANFIVLLCCCFFLCCTIKFIHPCIRVCVWVCCYAETFVLFG